MDMEYFNDMIVDLFHRISYEEEKAIITREFQDISNRDFHIIYAIGIDEPRNMSSIAKDLNITVGTLTIAVNHLLKKGYVVRKRGEKDRRVVYVSLSDKGKKAYGHHQEFHREMMGKMIDGLDDQEQKVLLHIMEYFYDYYKGKNQKNQ